MNQTNSAPGSLKPLPELIRPHRLVKLYVAANARGTGTAAALLAFGEQRIADGGITDAVLYCTAGNARAQNFYRREGWALSETFSDALWLPGGAKTTVLVDTHHFKKHLF